MTTNISPAQTIVLTRAIAMLRAAGVQFAVQMPDGTKAGDLEIAPPLKARVRLNNWNRDTGYIETLKTLSPGQNYTWLMPSEKAIGFQKVVSAQAGLLWGYEQNTFATTIHADGMTVEVLRVI